MELIQSPPLARMLAERIRPRCEQFYGLAILLQDDYAALSAVAGDVPNDDTIIEPVDGSPIPFRGRDFHAYLGLIAATLQAAADQTLLATVKAFCVRALDQCLLLLPGTIDPDVTDPIRRLVQARIKPRCRFFRAMRHLIYDDQRFIPLVMDEAWADADTIDEYRPDVGGRTVGEVRAILALEAAMIGPDVNTEAAALAVDAAAGTTLEVR